MVISPPTDPDQLTSSQVRNIPRGLQQLSVRYEFQIFPHYCNKIFKRPRQLQCNV